MKELKIEIPERHEIDTERSTFERIVFRHVLTRNKWYKTDQVGNEEWLCHFNGELFDYGFDSDGEFTKFSGNFDGDGSEVMVDNDYVSERLQKEAKKRGLLYGGYSFFPGNEYLIGHKGKDSGFVEIFYKGDWTPSIKEEKTTESDNSKPSYTISSSWNEPTQTGAVVVLNNDTGFFTHTSTHKCETALLATIKSIENSLRDAKIERIEERWS